MALLPLPPCSRILTRLYSIVRLQCIRNGSHFDTHLSFGLDYSDIMRVLVANRMGVVMFRTITLPNKACVVFG